MFSWVIYDKLFSPKSYLAAFFEIAPDFKVNFWLKFNLPHSPTFTKFLVQEQQSPAGLYWSIFCHSRGACLFRCDPASKVGGRRVASLLQKVSAVQSVAEVAPELDVADLPGSVTRCERWQAGDLSVAVAGFDTGYVIASVSPLGSDYVTDRKTLKFSGPVSVLSLVQPHSEQSHALLLISSTIGPATIWALGVEVSPALGIWG